MALAAGSLALTFFLPTVALWAPRLFHFMPIRVPQNLAGTALLILCSDFVLYWSHRASHTFRWQWAAHEAHHSSERLNFLASLRNGWTDAPAGKWVFMLPLALLGFSIEQWQTYFLINIAWQMFVHNEWSPKLGPLEWIFVTPSHHRMHHARQAANDARNFGNVLIVWDRLFGTFSAEGSERTTQFGVKGRNFHGVADVAFAEWLAMLGDLRRRFVVRSPRDRIATRL